MVDVFSLLKHTMDFPHTHKQTNGFLKTKKLMTLFWGWLFMVFVMHWRCVTWPFFGHVFHTCFRHQLTLKHSHSVNVISQSWMPFERKLLCRSPNSIMLVIAAMRPSTLWYSWTENSRPSLNSFMVVRMDSTQTGDNCARMEVKFHTTPRNAVLWYSERMLFLMVNLNPKHFRCVRTTSRCQTAISNDLAKISRSLI